MRFKSQKCAKMCLRPRLGPGSRWGAYTFPHAPNVISGKGVGKKETKKGFGDRKRSVGLNYLPELIIHDSDVTEKWNPRSVDNKSDALTVTPPSHHPTYS